MAFHTNRVVSFSPPILLLSIPSVWCVEVVLFLSQQPRIVVDNTFCLWFFWQSTYSNNSTISWNTWEWRCYRILLEVADIRGDQARHQRERNACQWAGRWESYDPSFFVVFCRFLRQQAWGEFDNTFVALRSLGTVHTQIHTQKVVVCQGIHGKEGVIEYYSRLRRPSKTPHRRNA